MQLIQSERCGFTHKRKAEKERAKKIESKEKIKEKESKKEEENRQNWRKHRSLCKVYAKFDLIQVLTTVFYCLFGQTRPETRGKTPEKTAVN